MTNLFRSIPFLQPSWGQLCAPGVHIIFKKWNDQTSRLGKSQYGWREWISWGFGDWGGFDLAWGDFFGWKEKTYWRMVNILHFGRVFWMLIWKISPQKHRRHQILKSFEFHSSPANRLFLHENYIVEVVRIGWTPVWLPGDSLSKVTPNWKLAERI